MVQIFQLLESRCEKKETADTQILPLFNDYYFSNMLYEQQQVISVFINVFALGFAS